MTIIQKIKKWHIIVLIILGIMGYWTSQNMWVFEKSIPIVDYEQALINTNWKNTEDKGINYFGEEAWEIYNNEGVIKYKGKWKLDNDFLSFEGVDYHSKKEKPSPFTHVIIKLSKNYLVLQSYLPRANIQRVEKFKKIEEKN